MTESIFLLAGILIGFGAYHLAFRTGWRTRDSAGIARSEVPVTFGQTKLIKPISRGYFDDGNSADEGDAG